DIYELQNSFAFTKEGAHNLALYYIAIGEQAPAPTDLAYNLRVQGSLVDYQKSTLSIKDTSEHGLPAVITLHLVNGNKNDVNDVAFDRINIKGYEDNFTMEPPDSHTITNGNYV